MRSPHAEAGRTLGRVLAAATLAALAACAVGEPGTPGSFTPSLGGRAGVYGTTSFGR